MTPGAPVPREDGPLFHRRTAAILMTVGMVAFIAFLALRDLAPEMKAWRSAGADAFSYSALGYRALVESLERAGIPVRIARFRTVRSTRAADVLVMAMPSDPDVARRTVSLWRTDADSARALVVVLPKWQGRRDSANPRWVESLETVSPRLATSILRTAASSPGTALVRRAGPARWQLRTPSGAPDVAYPQLIGGHGMLPVIGADHGDLIAREDAGDRTLVVISDPDLISNMGLGSGDNAAIAATLLGDLLSDGGEVVFDETIHGYETRPSLWRLLVTPRFLPAAIAGLLAMAAMAWMASGRFGAPAPRPGRRRDGKRALVDGGAGLLLQCGHGGAALAAYGAAVRRDVERRLHTPPGLSEAERDRWLHRVGEKRGTTADGPALVAAAERLGGEGVGESALVAQAAGLHRWKREMLDGG